MFGVIFCLAFIRIVFSAYQELASPNLKNDARLVKIGTKVDEITELRHKTKKQDHENTLKSLKIDNEYNEKKQKSLN